MSARESISRSPARDYVTTPPRENPIRAVQLEEGTAYYIDHVQTTLALSLAREEFAQLALEPRCKGDLGQYWVIYDVGDGHGHVAIVNPHSGQALRLSGDRMGVRVVPAIYDRYDKGQHWHIAATDLSDSQSGFLIKHGASGLYLGLAGATPGGHLAGWPLGKDPDALRWAFAYVTDAHGPSSQG